MIKDKIVQPEIRNMSIECDKVGGINLSQGISDRRLPKTVELEAIDAISSGNYNHTRNDYRVKKINNNYLI